VKRELERIEIPGEHEALLRAWEVVQAAYAEREPVPRRRPGARPLAAVALAAAVVAAVLSPPGRALIDSVREAIGVEDAEEALFSLPTGGRLLVDSREGPWIVQADGSKRLLGDYREASWSPTGRFVVATRENELFALDPDGEVKWTLARPNVRFPRWWGTQTDTRIAYLSGRSLHVVAGDGMPDRLVDPDVAPVAPAWRPGFSYMIAYVDADGTVRLLDLPTGARAALRQAGRPEEILWSPDGHLLAVRAGARVSLFRPDGRRLEPVSRPRPATSATFDLHETLTVAAHNRALDRSRVAVGRRTVFTGAGRVAELAWSPNGRWLLVAWPEADQWIFIRASGKKIEAVSNIAAQFGGAFPRVEGWCCASP
jgi:WD40 repeat protein